MKKICFMIAAAMLLALIAGCVSTPTNILAPGETAQATSDINLDDVEYTVSVAVQSLIKYDRIKMLPGGTRAVTVVPNTKIDTTRRGSGTEALAESITIRLQEELTNSGKILVFDPEAAQYATGNVPPVQYALISVLRSRNVQQDDGRIQIEYSLNLKLVDRASGLQYWQKSVPLRKVADRGRAL